MIVDEIKNFKGLKKKTRVLEKRTFETEEFLEFKRHSERVKDASKYRVISDINKKITPEYNRMLVEIRNHKFNRVLLPFLDDLHSKNYRLSRVYVDGFYVVRKNELN